MLLQSDYLASTLEQAYGDSVDFVISTLIIARISLQNCFFYFVRNLVLFVTDMITTHSL